MRDFTIDLIWTKIQIAVAALGGWLGYFLGGVDGLLYKPAQMPTVGITNSVCNVEFTDAEVTEIKRPL